MSDRSPDAELHAIQQLMAALEPLDAEARSRVVSYVFGRLGISGPARSPEFSVLASGSVPAEVSSATARPPQSQPLDIRTLREQKSPKSATEMAAVAAYYLSELAPPGERKREMTAADVTRLFKHAGFPLPGTPKMTLVHAKNAGYLDPGSERGTYVLNPVGYNLVAHKLPSGAPSPARSDVRVKLKRRSATGNARKTNVRRSR
jgi:hypothetical protein